MAIAKVFSTSVMLTLGFTACTSSVLSKRTDEQAWREYQKELRSHRAPASETKATSPDLDGLHALLDEVPVRTILLTCRGSKEAECYRGKLFLQFDEAFRKYGGLNDVVYKQERQAFLKARSYEAVLGEVEDFHRLLLSGMDLRAIDRIRDLNSDCESAEDAPVEVYAPFTGNGYEIPKGYFACLNAAWDQDASELLRETSDRLGLTFTTVEAGEWIKHKQIYPVYDEVTRSILAQKTDENRKDWDQSLDEMARHFDWTRSLGAFVKNESGALHEKYPFLPIEPMLTDLYQKHQAKKGLTKKDLNKGVESP